MNEEIVQEQKFFLSLIDQMKEIHTDNKSVVSTLDFLKDCVENRMVATDAN